MHIVHSIPNLNFSSGGPVRAIIDLSQKLADKGHEVTILTYEDSDAPENWRDNPNSNPRTITLGTVLNGGMRATPEQKKRITDAIAQAERGRTRSGQPRPLQRAPAPGAAAAGLRRGAWWRRRGEWPRRRELFGP